MVHAGGRPPEFKDVKELSDLIDKYFRTITITRVREADWIPVLNDQKEQIRDVEYTEIPSILWLCEYLDIHRKTLLEYEVKEEFSNTIKKAKQKIEKYNADQLMRSTQVTGIIFNLKNNFDWKDKSEVDQNNSWEVIIKWES